MPARLTRHQYELVALLAAGALASAPDGASAQRSNDFLAPGRTRDAFVVALDYAQPVGDFHRYVDQGFGIEVGWLHAFDRDGIVGLRVDGGYLIYGHQTKRVPLSSTIGGRILVDVSTNNNIIFFGVGPQILLPGRVLRPYLAGSLGLAYFFTESSVEGSTNTTPFAQTKNFDDATLAATGLAGLYIPLSRGRTPVSLDIGARYHWNGQASYLREGSIQDNPDNTVTITPLRSETDLVTWRIGVAIGAR
jgi:hypothetical protein